MAKRQAQFTSMAKLLKGSVDQARSSQFISKSELDWVAEIAAYIPRFAGNSLINHLLITSCTLPYKALWGF